MQKTWNSSSVCVMKTISSPKSSYPPSRCSVVFFLHEMWKAFHLVSWGDDLCYAGWKIWMRKHRKLWATLCWHHYLFQCNHTACYSTSHLAKIRQDLKNTWEQPIYFFNGRKRRFLQTNLKKLCYFWKPWKELPLHTQIFHAVTQ